MMKPKRARSTKGGINWQQQIEKDMEYCEERLLTDGGLDPLFLIHTKARLLVFPAPWRHHPLRSAMLNWRRSQI
jgi:hypothetical protein